MYIDPRLVLALFVVCFVVWFVSAVYVLAKTKRPLMEVVKDSGAALVVILGAASAGVIIGEIVLYVIKGW